jgi:predicted transcriptional regulator
MLQAKPCTFTELLLSTKLSRPTLTNHLGELKKDKMIEHSDEKRTYALTPRGKAALLMKSSFLAHAVNSASKLGKTGLISNEMAQSFISLAKLATEKPEVFQTLMDWLLDLSLFTESDPFFQSYWLKILGKNPEEMERFNEMLTKKKFQPPKIPIDTPENLRVTLDSVSNSIKEFLQSEKKRERRT